MLSGNHKYYEVFGKAEEKRRDVEFSTKVLERCEGILSTVRDCFNDAEKKFNENR